MKGGRYIDDGQYAHHVWLYRTVQSLLIDLACYGTCFKMYEDGKFIERLDPREVMIYD